ncbi:MAG: thermonuclease family protein, partial [Candidatus Marinimicrobia bacterium]|nr:thermonuclease family protein [Candidatus Neomarinimicrobiota bacterium]
LPGSNNNDRKESNSARDFLRKLILDREVLLKTVKDRKNRGCGYMVEMVVVTEKGETVNVNEALVQAGHAEFIEG